MTKYPFRNHEKVLESGTLGFDFDKNVMIMNFESPVKRSFDLSVLVVNDEYEVDVACRGGKGEWNLQVKTSQVHLSALSSASICIFTNEKSIF